MLRWKECVARSPAQPLAASFVEGRKEAAMNDRKGESPFPDDLERRGGVVPGGAS